MKKKLKWKLAFQRCFPQLFLPGKCCRHITRQCLSKRQIKWNRREIYCWCKMWGRLFKKDELECEWKLREGEEKENCMHNTWLPQQCFHSTDSDRQMPVICYPIFGPKLQNISYASFSVTIKNIPQNRFEKWYFEFMHITTYMFRVM